MRRACVRAARRKSRSARSRASKKLRKTVDGYDLVIADTRGLADDFTTDVAEESDVIFLPTGTSRDDLYPTIALARRLVKKGADGKLAIVLSKVGRSERQLQTAMEVIAEAGFESFGAVWPLREGFQSDLDTGRAGSEARNPHLRAAAEALEKAMLARVARS
jgi:chromosome partitioning protein